MTALRSLRSSSRWNCHSPRRQATQASAMTMSEEEHPPSAEQEAEASHCSRLSGGPARGAGEPLPGRGGSFPRRWHPHHLDWVVTTRMLPLADAYGRVATDLRVSLTDRCNLRCSYCMPAEGLDWLPDDQTLTDDEVVRLITIGVRRLGVQEVRFTGGEPLVRRGLVDIVRRTHELGGVETSLTTNALGLAAQRAGAARRGPGPGQRQPRHRAPGDLPPGHPPRPPRRRDRRPRGRPRRRPRAAQAQRRAAARASTTTRRPSCCAGRWSGATTCGSSSRCRWTPSTAGAAPR